MSGLVRLSRHSRAPLFVVLSAVTAIVVGSVVIASPLKNQDRQIVDVVIDATVGNVGAL